MRLQPTILTPADSPGFVNFFSQATSLCFPEPAGRSGNLQEPSLCGHWLQKNNWLGSVVLLKLGIFSLEILFLECH